MIGQVSKVIQENQAKTTRIATGLGTTLSKLFTGVEELVQAQFEPAHTVMSEKDGRARVGATGFVFEALERKGENIARHLTGLEDQLAPRKSTPPQRHRLMIRPTKI